MTDRDRLIELLEDTLHEWECDVQPETLSQIADHLISNGVIVAPMPMADWLKQELTEYVHQRCMEEL